MQPVPREEYRFHLRSRFSKPMHQFDAAYTRHCKVRYHERDLFRMATENVERFRTVAGDEDRISRSAQCLRQEDAERLLVVDDQDCRHGCGYFGLRLLEVKMRLYERVKLA